MTIGRPVGTKISFNKEDFTAWDILNTALSYGATLEECAHLLDVGENTILRRMKEVYDVSFAEYQNRYVKKNIVKFRQELFKMACDGRHPSVTIFYAKNKLGMTDKTEVYQTNTNMSLEEFLKIESEKLKEQDNEQGN